MTGDLVWTGDGTTGDTSGSPLPVLPVLDTSAPSGSGIPLVVLPVVDPLDVLRRSGSVSALGPLPVADTSGSAPLLDVLGSDPSARTGDTPGVLLRWLPDDAAAALAPSDLHGWLPDPSDTSGSGTSDPLPVLPFGSGTTSATPAAMPVPFPLGSGTLGTLTPRGTSGTSDHLGFRLVCWPRRGGKATALAAVRDASARDALQRSQDAGTGTIGAHHAR